MYAPTRPKNAVDLVQAEFLSLLPTIQNAVRFQLRLVPCPDRRADLVCEALAWAWYVRLARKGRSPVGFLVHFARLAARAVLSGRRLCGCETAKDALSPVCQRRRGFTVSPLPDGSGMAGTVFDDALRDNAQTPVPDQVQFRLDFPRWRASLCHRTRKLMDEMAAGHRTTDLAATFGLTQGRISQVRRELHAGWRAFCGDDIC